MAMVWLASTNVPKCWNNYCRKRAVLFITESWIKFMSHHDWTPLWKHTVANRTCEQILPMNSPRTAHTVANIQRDKLAIVKSEKEGCFVSRRDDRVSHPGLTEMHILKRIFFGRLRELTIRVRYPAVCSSRLEVILDNIEVSLCGADLILERTRPGW